MVLGRDLGPAIDILPAMTRKILKPNGKVVNRSTVCALAPDEMAGKTMTQSRKDFTKNVNAVLGDGFKYEDFVTDPELKSFDTPTFENYSDDDDGDTLPALPDIDDKGHADTHYQYVGAEVTLHSETG